MKLLDRLDQLERENRKAKYSGEGFEFESMVLNNARALIEVARAAEILLKSCCEDDRDLHGMLELEEALERLEK
jgi:hypothetical protein